jgi:hypothetical protein
LTFTKLILKTSRISKGVLALAPINLKLIMGGAYMAEKNWVSFTIN